MLRDEIVLSHKNGATTKVTVYRAAEDDAVVVEIDTDASTSEPTEVRVWVNEHQAVGEVVS